MTRLATVLTMVLFIGVNSGVSVDGISTTFIYPVLGDELNQTLHIIANTQDPRLRGWFTHGNQFGAYYPTNPVCQYDYHPGEDWNRFDARENAGSEPVFSIGANGYVVRVVNGSSIGGSILIRYKLSVATDFTPYFLSGTIPTTKYRYGEYILVQYMHVEPEAGLVKGSLVTLGQRVGTILAGYD
ncbi:MAG: hypothetical protein Q8Q23_00575, partial [bacterium]|nr:hypothetical protein [bacterium]